MIPRLATTLLLAILCLGPHATEATTDGGLDLDERTRALQRSLFRNGGVPVAEARPEETPRPPRLQPPAPRLAIVPPPVTPATLAMRELSLQPTSFTPYDRFLSPVRRVIAELDPRKASMLRACELMREGRRFRYTAADPYRADLPDRTAARRAGDCKAKALWLYDRLGDPAALYVIGKLQRGARSSHAWVYWRNQGRWWILDPTDRSTPIAADSVAPNRYVPYYSLGTGGAYRHPATSLYANTAPRKEPMPAVAGKSGPPASAPRDKRLAKRW